MCCHVAVLEGVLFLPLFVIPVIFFYVRDKKLRAFYFVICMILTYLITMTPWIIRNYRIYNAFIFCSLILANPPLVDLFWGLTALVGALLVSYTRARGEAVGVTMAAVGIAERAERILIIAIATFLGVVWVGIVIVALLSLLTVIHRIVHVYQKTS